MDILYKNLTEHFKSPEVKKLFTTAGLPELRTIDLNMGQVNNPEGFEIFYPAMFIDWRDNQKKNEALDLELSFHILQIPSFNAENFSENLQEGLAYLRTLKTIKKALNLFKTANASKLSYKGSMPSITPFYKYHILSYSAQLDNTTAEPNITNVELKDINFKSGIKEHIEDLPIAIETY